MRARRRAFMMVLALFLMIVITIMGLAYLGSGALRYQGSVTNLATQQAQALAESGIEDVRVKLERDPHFPPALGDQGYQFSYTETVTDVGSLNPLGTYAVLVDSTWALAPYYVIQVTSTGTTQTNAQARIQATFDICPFDRTSTATVPPANPNAFQIINWSESGNL